jgi:hypothetical protein
MRSLLCLFLHMYVCKHVFSFDVFLNVDNSFNAIVFLSLSKICMHACRYVSPVPLCNLTLRFSFTSYVKIFFEDFEGSLQGVQLNLLLYIETLK